MKPSIVFQVLLLFLLLVLYGCLKPRLIEVETIEVRDPTSTTATASGEIISLGEGISEYGHCWSTFSNPSYELNHGKTTFGAAENTGTFTSYLDNLEENTLYYVCAYVVGENEPSRHGEVLEFRTGQGIDAPTVTTNSVTSYTSVSAIVGGNVTSDGGASVTERGIYWSTVADPRSTGTKFTIGTGTGTFSDELSGLSPGGTYFIEAYAYNGTETGYGGVVNFTTNTTPSIQQQFSYGGSDLDRAESLVQTSDGGYAIGGWTSSMDGDISVSYGSYDYWLVNLDENANLNWQKSFGGSRIEVAESVIQTYDNGYVLAGHTESSDIDVSENHGRADFWVVKLSSTGDLLWETSLGGTDYDLGFSVIQTSDGGFAVAGYTSSSDGDITSHHGEEDFWVVKLNANGELVWQRTFGGSSSDKAYSIFQTADNGFVVTGESLSNDGEVSGNHGYYDIWVVKLNSNGDLQWQGSYGGSDWDTGESVIQTSDGGYAITGCTYSIDGDVSGYHGLGDMWVIKLNSSGSLLWQRSLGGSYRDWGFSIIQTLDSGYAIAGFSESNDGDAFGNHGGNDCWVVKLNSAGNLQWQKLFGGSSHDRARDIVQTSDGGYAFTGYCKSSDGDLSENKGSDDYWVVILK